MLNFFFFYIQSSSLLNLSASTTVGSTPKTDFFEPSIGQLIAVFEFQGNHVYNGLKAAISFLETKKSQGAKPGKQGSWETTAMSLTDKNCCTDKA
jgi:GH15 family glucan-1,4-alpha-glucosidase